MGKATILFIIKLTYFSIIYLGTPGAVAGGMKLIMEKVEHEAQLFKKHNVHGVIIENMHDTPYCLEKDQGIGWILLLKLCS